jgi:hypothetical protein
MKAKKIGKGWWGDQPYVDPPHALLPKEEKEEKIAFCFYWAAKRVP